MGPTRQIAECILCSESDISDSRLVLQIDIRLYKCNAHTMRRIHEVSTAVPSDNPPSRNPAVSYGALCRVSWATLLNICHHAQVQRLWRRKIWLWTPLYGPIQDLSSALCLRIPSKVFPSVGNASLS